MSFYDKLKFDANGLIPAIIQEQKSGRVVMMAWMNRASLENTIATGKTHFWSRSRQKFWMKGEESGNTQTVKDVAFDCDGDTLADPGRAKRPGVSRGLPILFLPLHRRQGRDVQDHRTAAARRRSRCTGRNERRMHGRALTRARRQVFEPRARQ